MAKLKEMKSKTLSAITSVVVSILIFSCSGSRNKAGDEIELSVDLSKNTGAKMIAGDGPLRFPRQAMLENKAGFVDVEFVVQTTGNADKIKVVREFPEGYGFGDAAIEHVKGLRFTPAVLNGKIINQSIQRTYNFKLEK